MKFVFKILKKWNYLYVFRRSQIHFNMQKHIYHIILIKAGYDSNNKF